jgi:hypothetical protein
MASAGSAAPVFGPAVVPFRTAGLKASPAYLLLTLSQRERGVNQI